MSRTIVAEYAGVAVGGLSMLFLSKRGNQARKVSRRFFVYCLQQERKEKWSAHLTYRVLQLRLFSQSEGGVRAKCSKSVLLVLVNEMLEPCFFADQGPPLPGCGVLHVFQGLVLRDVVTVP
jgi:hypothetical protein